MESGDDVASAPSEHDTYDDVDIGDSKPFEVEDSTPSNSGPFRKSRIESLEIELGAPPRDAEQEEDTKRLVSVPSEGGDDDEEDGDEAVSLLAKSDSKTETQASDNDDGHEGTTAGPSCKCCEPELRMGNINVPNLYVYGYTGGWGVIGPHFMGPPFLIALIGIATYYFVVQCSLRRHWYWTGAVCSYFGLQTLYFLLNAAYRDPGVVREGRLNLPDPVPRSYRWCESCNYYQPPTTMHCPSCEACIAGFDHHCVWMGTCVGVGTFQLKLVCKIENVQNCSCCLSLMMALNRKFQTIHEVQSILD